MKRPEEAETAAVVKTITTAGGECYRLDQGYRREKGGTRMTAGIPDLWVFFPAIRKGAWFEVKSPEGLREWQRLAAIEAPNLKWRYKAATWREWEYVRRQWAFGEQCKLNGVPWGIGGIEECKAWLFSLNLARYIGGVLTLGVPRLTISKP